MVKMTTIDPRAFVLFKMWMSAQKDRDPIKKHRDKNQARLVTKLIEEYLPHLGFDELENGIEPFWETPTAGGSRPGARFV
jgi:hypothetical protein